MKTCLHFWTLALILTLAAGARADDKPKEKEKEATTIKGWGKLVDPDGDCRAEEKDGLVTITVPGMHHDLTHTEKYTKLNAPRVLQNAEGDFALKVTVKAFPIPADVPSSGGDHSFQSSGLLIWVDERNYVRMERAAVSASKRPFVWIERFADGKPVTQKLVPVNDKDIGLRVVRKDNAFTYYVDGGEGGGWVEAHLEEAELPKKLQVGVAAISSAAREFPAKLTELELAQEEEKKKD